VGGAFSASCGCDVDTSTAEEGEEDRLEKVGDVCGGVCVGSSGELDVEPLSPGKGYSKRVEWISEKGVPTIIEDGE